MAQHEANLKEMGLRANELKRAMDPLRSFALQFQEEIDDYDRLKRGELGENEELRNLQGLGVLLIRLRIASGLTQKELAQRLEVHESQVSRDERNEYHGITMDRANRILEALGVDLRCVVHDYQHA